jgi:hypothetical protein
VAVRERHCFEARVHAEFAEQAQATNGSRHRSFEVRIGGVEHSADRPRRLGRPDGRRLLLRAVDLRARKVLAR